MCNCFAPVVFERRAYHTRSSRGVSARRTFTTVHTQGEPFLILCMYVGSDVSLAEYLCTHVAIIYISTEDAATPSDGFYVDVDINE